jgi:hypothetical protein
MIDWHAIIGKCNQSVDVHCQKLSLSLLLVCLFLFRFGEASNKMVPTRKIKQMAGTLVLDPLPISNSDAIDTLRERMMDIVDDPSKVLNKGFMMNMFRKYVDALPTFKEQ